MRPPRLTIVPNDPAAVEEGRREEAPPEAANDAAPVGSPVHELMATLSAEAAPSPERREKLRILEAVLFAAADPMDEGKLALSLKAGDDVAGLMAELAADYAMRGVNLIKVAGKWSMRTAPDLSWVLERHTQEERRLSKAALETLAIVAYHQPVTRAEIEEVRGVTISKGTLDVLMEAGWIRPRGRRRAPGNPITYGTTETFLSHFGLDGIKDLPGLAELKGSGLLDANLPPDFKVPAPTDIAALMPDELPLEDGAADDEAQSELELDEVGEPDADDDTADDIDGGATKSE